MQNQNHTNNFDFIRFLGASFVLITHSYALKGIADGKDFLGLLTHEQYPFSFFGVRIFFSISGYLILQSFERKTSYRDYLWKRSLRIFPGLIVLLVLMVFVFGPIFTSQSLKEYFTNIETYKMLGSVSLYRIRYYLPGNFEEHLEKTLMGSLWTLPYEFTMYLSIMVLGLVKILKYRYFNLIIWLLLIVICVLYPSYFSSILGKDVVPILNLKIWCSIEFSCFFLGGMLIYQFKDKIMFTWKIFILIVFAMLVSNYFNNQFFVRLVVYACLPYFIFYLSYLKGFLNYFGRFGDFSYGIYIYGFPIQQMLVFLTKNQTSVLHIQVLSFAIVLPLAFLSWHLVEKSALKYKNLFSSRGCLTRHRAKATQVFDN